MPYRLSLAEPVPAAVRRCAAGELERAAALLRDDGSDPERAVHEARKAVKKTRALLRLVAPGVPRDEGRRLQGTLREAGGLLAGTRDADVAVRVAGDLAAQFAGRVPGTAFEALGARLADRAGARRGEQAREEAAQALEALAAGVPGWPLDDCGRRHVRDGAARTYARGRDALALAARSPGTEELHDWRKRVKDLWYHQRLLEDLWPEVLRAHAGQAKALSELLGDDHDAAVLAELLRTDEELAGDPRAQAEAVAALADERRAALQRDALRLGHLVYADGPKAVRRRLGRWLDVAGDAGTG